VDGVAQLLMIEFPAAFRLARYFAHMGHQIDRTQITDCNLLFIGVERDFGTQIRAMNHSNMLLRRAQVAGILEGDPGMPGLKKHRKHFSPQLHRLDGLVKLEFATGCFCFVGGIGLLKGPADFLMQVHTVRWRKQGPGAVFHHPLHEQVGDPICGIHVVGAPTIVTGVFAQLQKLFDIKMPGLKVGTYRTLAFAALIDRHGGVIHNLQKRHHALALAVGTLDMTA